jgi:regulator of RNase E activity RraA
MYDEVFFASIKEYLFVAVVGDVLDTMGYRNQFLPQPIKPLVAGQKIVGRAMPVLEADYPDGAGQGPLNDQPFGVMFAALDDLQPGEIYIASGSSLDYALWGGWMSTRAQHLAAAGAILNGYIRDCDEIRR